jgi:hypothetical protein
VLDDQADEMLSQALKVAIHGSRRDEVHSQLRVDHGGIGGVQDRLLFNERGEQVEESPLTLVEILSRNRGDAVTASRTVAAAFLREVTKRCSA